MLSLLLTISLLNYNAQKVPPVQRTFAVIVGVSDYKLGQPGKGDLNYSDDDARIFSDFLKSRAGGSVPANQIRLLTDRQASRQHILQAMTVFKKATPDDRIIFYFSGHGDDQVFLPYDASPGVALPHQDIKDAFRGSAAGTKLLLADACMSGTMKEHTAGTSARVAKPVSRQSSTNSNVIVMMSSRLKETPQESSNSLESSNLKQGTFTYYLVRGAQGEADDAPKDGIVTIWELHNYVSRNVQKLTSKKQIPAVFGRFDKNLAFTRLSP